MTTNNRKKIKPINLSPYFLEIKELLPKKSVSKIAEELSAKYSLNIRCSDVNNYLYIKESFDVKQHRNNVCLFDIKKAKAEDNSPV